MDPQLAESAPTARASGLPLFGRIINQERVLPQRKRAASSLSEQSPPLTEASSAENPQPPSDSLFSSAEDAPQTGPPEAQAASPDQPTHAELTQAETGPPPVISPLPQANQPLLRLLQCIQRKMYYSVKLPAPKTLERLLQAFEASGFPKSDIGQVYHCLDHKHQIHMWKIEVTNMLTPSPSGDMLPTSVTGCHTWWAHTTTPTGITGILRNRQIHKQVTDGTWETNGFLCSATTCPWEIQTMVVNQHLSRQNQAGVIVFGKARSKLPSRTLRQGGLTLAQEYCGLNDHCRIANRGRNTWLIKPEIARISALYLCEDAFQPPSSSTLTV
jgi:hypothetical protein